MKKRIPESIEDFPKIQLVEPILENFTRILFRDLPLALQILSKNATPESACGHLELPQIFQGRPLIPTAPAIHIMWLDSEFTQTSKSLDQVWRIAVEVVLFTEDTNCGSIELMRYLQAVSWILLRYNKPDMWATEDPSSGISYVLTLSGWDSPDALEAHNNRLVKRGRVLFTVNTLERGIL